MTSVVVIGATGHLGGKIVESLQRRTATVRAIVRPGSTHAAAARALTAEGVDVVPGDLPGSLEDLVRAVAGSEVIVSAVQGGEDVIVAGQTRLAQAAEKAGVPRLIRLTMRSICSGSMTATTSSWTSAAAPRQRSRRALCKRPPFSTAHSSR